MEPQFLPFIGIELKVLKLRFQEGVATIDSAIVAQPDDMLIVSVDEPDKDDQSGSVPRDRTW